MTDFKTARHHWNYFLALDKDLERISRYIEFCNDNLKVYSIELTHILLSASSEVDVVMKQLSYLIDPSHSCKNINGYKIVIKTGLPLFIDEEISIDRFNLSYRPWSNWAGEANPDWWKNYNRVKHNRDQYFSEANLENTINSVGALLLAVIYYYKYAFSKEIGRDFTIRNTTLELGAASTFLMVKRSYYHDYLIG